MQQQHADYDLLAVFTDEKAANSAVTSLEKAGYSSDEIFQLAAGSVGSGQFREHGPDRSRGDYFLQTRRTRPTLLLILLFAVAFGLIFGGAAFLIALILVLVHLLAFTLEPITALGGAILGIIIGAVTALQHGTRIRGNIGQKTVPTTATAPTANQDAKTVVAIRLPDPENIRRKSQAQAILIQNQGKIDRSVSRSE
jgi:hypothetical protein